MFLVQRNAFDITFCPDTRRPLLISFEGILADQRWCWSLCNLTFVKIYAYRTFYDDHQEISFVELIHDELAILELAWAHFWEDKV